MDEPYPQFIEDLMEELQEKWKDSSIDIDTAIHDGVYECYLLMKRRGELNNG